MVRVNNKTLRETINHLSKLVNKQEEATLDLFRTIDYTSGFWMGERASSFYARIAEQRNINDVFKNNLKNRLAIYQYINKEYSKFGEIINCDYRKKEEMQKNINFSVEHLDEINRRLTLLDISFAFRQKDALIIQRNQLAAFRNKIKNYQAGLVKHLDRVETIELEIQKRFGQLQEMKMTDFVFERIRG